jgi:hypothetical protein
METPVAKAKKLIQDRIDDIKAKARKKVEMTDPAQEPDSWLRNVRWHYHLAGKGEPEELRALIKPVDDEGEKTLAVIHASFQRVIAACRIHATNKVVGESALCTVNSTEYEKKVQDPFYMDMKDSTDMTYQTVWLKVLSYMVRSETEWDAEDRPGYRLTSSQRRLFEKVISQVTAFQGVEVTEDMSPEATKQMTELDWQCLQLCIQLLDHKLPGDAYENVIISGLSILGIREGGGG